MDTFPHRTAAEQQWQEQRAAQRFAETERARTRTRQLQERTGVPVHDTFDQLRARAERLAALLRAPAPAPAEPDPVRRHRIYQRVIGAANQAQSVGFLYRGARAAASVARLVHVHHGRELPCGTGFLVAPDLLLTNHHVLDSPEAAEQAVAEFAAEVDADLHPRTPVRHRLDPEGFFVADRELDFALVRVRPDAEGRPPGAVFGWNPLLRTQGKVVTGEPVNIVGHPRGRLKEIAIRGGRLLQQTEDFLQYSADTEPGSSGSPVYNDQWEVVALHHSAVPRRDAHGRRLRTDGTPLRPGDPDSAAAWLGNEGTRVSSILDFLAAADLPRAQRDLLASLGPGAGLPPADGRAAPKGPQPFWARERLPRSGRSGVRGSGGPDDVHLVFVHGRGMEGRDPARLRAAWTAALNSGLLAAGLPTVPAASAWFPYYGDLLAELTADAAATESVDLAEALAPPLEEPHAVYAALLEQAALRSGMPAELAGGPADQEGASALGLIAPLTSRLQRELSWVAARSGLDEALIALFLRDVAAYLGEEEVRTAVLDRVAEGFPQSGQVVVVGHSLGTVVAVDLLSRARPDVTVPLLVTVGSPLGLDAVHERVLLQPPRRPDRVAAWLNAWTPADAATIGCPLSPVWGPGLVEVVTANSRRRPHDVEEYLRQPRVAVPVAEALYPDGVPAPPGLAA